MGLIAVMAEPSANESWSRRRIRRAAERLHKKATFWQNGVLFFQEGGRVPEAPLCPKPARHVRVQCFSEYSIVPATARIDTPIERTPDPKPNVALGNGKLPDPVTATKEPRKKLSLPEGRTPPVRKAPQRGAGGQFLSRRQI